MDLAYNCWMLDCNVEVQVAGQRECLPAAVNSLCQGSVLDVLRPQPSSVTAVDEPAEAHRMLNCELTSIHCVPKKTGPPNSWW